jgi:hypothetical protein
MRTYPTTLHLPTGCFVVPSETAETARHAALRTHSGVGADPKVATTAFSLDQVNDAFIASEDDSIDAAAVIVPYAICATFRSFARKLAGFLQNRALSRTSHSQSRD